MLCFKTETDMRCNCVCIHTALILSRSQIIRFKAASGMTSDRSELTPIIKVVMTYNDLFCPFFVTKMITIKQKKSYLV